MDGVAPALIQRGSFFEVLWLVDLRNLTESRHLIEALPQATGKAVHDDGTQGGGVIDLRADDGGFQHVGLELHEELVLCGSAIGTNLTQATAGSTSHHVDQILKLESDRLQSGT